MKKKPNDIQRVAHNVYAQTDRQLRRMAEGRKESKPSDYWYPSAEQRRLAKVRAELEDRRMMKELGL